MTNLFKVKAKSGDKYKILYVEGFNYSDVESFVLGYCFSGTKTLKKFSEIKSIELVGNNNQESFLKTFTPKKEVEDLTEKPSNFRSENYKNLL